MEEKQAQKTYRKWLPAAVGALLTVLVALALILLSRGAGTAEGINLLLNGDFSQADGEGFPLHWYADAYDGLSNALFETVTEDETPAAHIVNRVPKDARFAQRVAVEPNALYLLHGYIRASASGGRGANLSVEGLALYSDQVYDSKGQWQEVSLYGATGENQKFVTIYARLGGYSGEAIGEAYFRDVSLTRVDSVPLGAYANPWYTNAAPAVEEAASGSAGTASLFLVFCAALYLILFAALCRFLRKPGTVLEEQPGGWKAYAPLACLLLIGLGVRLLIAFLVRGYDVDIGCFTGWANDLAHSSPSDFYQFYPADNRWNCDYPPGYLWILWLLGGLGRLLGTGATEIMVKLPPILADLGLCTVLYSECRKRLSQQASLACVLLYALNPLILVSGAAWGQADSLMTLLLALVVLFALRDQWRFALPVYMAAVLFKPQALMFGPLGLAALILSLSKRFRDKKARSALLLDIGLGLWIMLICVLVIAGPFILHQPVSFLLDLYTKTMGQYFYATVNCCNVYFLLGKNWADAAINISGSWIPALSYALITLPLLAVVLRRTSLGQIRQGNPKEKAFLWVPVSVALFFGVLLAGMTFVYGNVTYSSLGTVMIAYGVTLMAGLYFLSGDLSNLPLYGAGMLIALCATGSMMHERYIFPAAALLLWAYALKKDTRILWLAVGVSIAGFLNVGCVLDRNIRIGNFAGSLDSPLHRIVSDSAVLEYFSAALNCAVCMASVALCTILCREEAIVIQPAARARSPLPKDSGLRPMTGRDYAIMLTVTVLYAVLAFANLGSMKAPQNAFVVPVAPQRVVMDLAEDRDFCVSYYTNYHRQDSQVTIEVSPDGDDWTPAFEETIPADVYYLWNMPHSGDDTETPLVFHGRFVRFTSDMDTFGQFTASFADPETMEELQAVKISNAVYDEQAVLDLGEEKTFHMLYYGGIHQLDSDFSVEISSDGEIWNQYYAASMKIGQCFQWQYLSAYSGGYPISLTGRFIRVTAGRTGLNLGEVLFRDAEDQSVLPVTLLYDTLKNDTAAALIDEQDTLEGEPGWFNSTYFDEIYHARTGYEHLHGMQPYESTHPPLGKVLISWCIALFGMTPFGWRFAGALAGVLMLPGMYLLGRLLIRRKWGGLAASLLLALDLMHFTQTRIATIDSFVVLFIIWMIYFMLRWFYQDFFRMKFWKTLIPLALSGLFMGLGVASKWTGCYAGVALALIFFLGIWRRYRLVRSARKIQWRRAKASKRKRRVFRLSPASRPMPADRRAPWQLRAQKKGVRPLLITVASCLVFFVLVPALIYYVSYIPYFAYNGGVTVQKIVDAANYMLWYHSQPGFGMDHPYYSPWYQWPVIYKPMFYAASIYEPAGYESSIMAFGNPAIWWGGLAGLIGVCFLALRRHLLADRTLSPYVEKDDSRAAVLLICFFVQYLPWVLVPRGTYIYHYFPCVPFIILCALLCLDHLSHRSRKAGAAALAVFLIAAAILFIGFFPYASGMLTPIWWMDMMRWFPRIYY